MRKSGSWRENNNSSGSYTQQSNESASHGNDNGHGDAASFVLSSRSFGEEYSGLSGLENWTGLHRGTALPTSSQDHWSFQSFRTDFSTSDWSGVRSTSSSSNELGVSLTHGSQTHQRQNRQDRNLQKHQQLSPFAQSAYYSATMGKSIFKLFPGKNASGNGKSGNSSRGATRATTGDLRSNAGNGATIADGRRNLEGSNDNIYDRFDDYNRLRYQDQTTIGTEASSLAPTVLTRSAPLNPPLVANAVPSALHHNPIRASNITSEPTTQVARSIRGEQEQNLLTTGKGLTNVSSNFGDNANADDEESAKQLAIEQVRQEQIRQMENFQQARNESRLSLNTIRQIRQMDEIDQMRKIQERQEWEQREHMHPMHHMQHLTGVEEMSEMEQIEQIRQLSEMQERSASERNLMGEAASIQHAEFQPLVGASVVILANFSSNFISFGPSKQSRQDRQMNEERASIGGLIESLGGRWVKSLIGEHRELKNDVEVSLNGAVSFDDSNAPITHAIWISGQDQHDHRPQSYPGQHAHHHSHKQRHQSSTANPLAHISNRVLMKLSTCKSNDIPIVNPSWLSQISNLNPGQHWSEVDVGEHAPVEIEEWFESMKKQQHHSTLNSKRSSRDKTEIQSNLDETTLQDFDSNGSRRDSAKNLSASIDETYQELLHKNPDLMEEEAIKRAMELSMLDFAIVHHIPSERGYVKHEKRHSNAPSPHEILKIEQSATPDQIKAAYRRRALETHPDKGGKPGEFEAVARAYRMLLNASTSSGGSFVNSMQSSQGGWDDSVAGSFEVETGEIALKSTAHWDSNLKEHRNLVQEMYQNHGEDLENFIVKQNSTLDRLGLKHQEAGTRNLNEKNEVIRNSCFYLSLAWSYLCGIGALAVLGDVENSNGQNVRSGPPRVLADEEDDTFDDGFDTSSLGGGNGDAGDSDEALLREADDALIMECALTLKRTIEAAVLSAHPEWAAKGMVGEEVQAFSDFLVYTLESQTILSEWAVVVFDTCSGFVDVYRGKNYKDETDPQAGEGNIITETSAATNTLTLRFVPGHYQPLVSAMPEAVRPTLKKIISALDESGVLYVITDGAAE